MLRNCRNVCHIFPSNNSTALGSISRTRTTRLRLYTTQQTPHESTANPSSQPPLPRSSERPVFSKVATALITLGTGSLLYGLYNIYDTMTMWPPEVRQDLRKGLREKEKGRLNISALYLTRAWKTTQTLPLSAFSTQPYLKVTGVAITLGVVLEDLKSPELAYTVYAEALACMEPALKASSHTNDTFNSDVYTLSGSESIRAVALAYKLAELAVELHKPPAEEEKWLVASVKTIVENVMEPRDNSITADEEEKGSVVKLEFPKWVNKPDMAAPFETLAQFYSKVGNFDHAKTLYLHATKTLMSDQTPENRCRGAQLMGNIAELSLRMSLSQESLRAAETWATKALEIVEVTKKEHVEVCEACEVAYAVMLFNVGMMKDLNGEPTQARKFFMQSLKQSRDIKLEEGIVSAQNELRRMASPAEILDTAHK